MRRHIGISLFTLFLASGLVACKKKPEPKGPEQAGAPAASEDGKPAAEHRDEPEEHGELPTRVRLPPTVIAAAGIRTQPAEKKKLPLTVDLTGEVAADPDRSARVAARVPGRIVEVHCKEGERVKAGQLLASIVSPELARARAAFSGAQARAGAAARNAERLTGLAKTGMASGQEVEAAQAEEKALQAEAAAAQRTLLSFGLTEGELGRSGARLDLLAPITGVVAARDAIIGQTVGAEQVLCALVDLSRAYFLGRLFEKNLVRVRTGEAAEVRLNAYPGEVFLGTVESIGQQLDPTARTVIARIAIQNREERLKVGLFGTARVTSTEAPPQGEGLLVPITAVTRIADKDVVFVRQADGDFEVHPVTLGRSASGQTEILSGLRPGEQVVLEGVFTLKSAVLKSTFGEEE